MPSLELWKKKFAERRDAPPGGWHAYLKAAWSGNVEGWRAAYRLYLRSEAWRLRKQGVLRRIGGKCQLCPSTEHIQVHHVTYERIGIERREDLRGLCRSCHALQHSGSFRPQAIPLDEKTRRRAEARALAAAATPASRPAPHVTRRPQPSPSVHGP